MARLRATAPAARSVLDGREHGGTPVASGNRSTPIRPSKSAHASPSKTEITLRYEATREHHSGATSPTAEAMRSDRIQSEFKSPVAYHHGRLGQRQSPTAQNGLQSGFESPVGYHFTRLAQRKSVGPTNRRARFRNSQRVPSCVFSSAAERARDMREAAGSSLQEAPLQRSCISVAENAADNRGTQVRFLTGAPTRNHHHEHRWQTGLRTRRVKPEWRGSGLLTRPQVDRNHPGPPFKGPVASMAERGTLNP